MHLTRSRRGGLDRNLRGLGHGAFLRLLVLVLILSDHRLIFLEAVPDIREVEETVLIEPQVDECRL